jgi:hypothetical protein
MVHHGVRPALLRRSTQQFEDLSKRHGLFS